jgi:hypothetical protein
MAENEREGVEEDVVEGGLEDWRFRLVVLAVWVVAVVVVVDGLSIGLIGFVGWIAEARDRVACAPLNSELGPARGGRSSSSSSIRASNRSSMSMGRELAGTLTTLVLFLFLVFLLLVVVAPVPGESTTALSLCLATAPPLSHPSSYVSTSRPVGVGVSGARVGYTLDGSR